jgi:HNH endonuclease
MLYVSADDCAAVCQEKQGIYRQESNVCSMAKCRIAWAAVQRAYDSGRSPLECSIEFRFSRGAWRKACMAGHLEVPPQDRNLRKGTRKLNLYDWQAIQAFYDLGNTYRQCREAFGFSEAAWSKALGRGDLRTRPRAHSVEWVLARSTSRLSVKRTLLRAGLLENRCDECGITEWRGRALAIQIDHRNGVRHDHRLENLRMLCPNCHSQTETFAAKNRQRKKRNDPGSSNGKTAVSDIAYCGSNP